MRTKEEILPFLNAIGDQLEAFVSEHERERHGGDMCMGERISVIAFLCHRLGVTDQNPMQMKALPMMIADYRENCPNCNHEAN